METHRAALDENALAALKGDMRGWAESLGFTGFGVGGVAIEEDERHLARWIADGWHGSMDYMARYGSRRARVPEIVPGALRVISVRMNYLPPAADPDAVLADGRLAYVSRYALGRDYHKLMRRRLQQLAERMEQRIGPFGYRVFVDSGPLLEKALARGAGLGWIGKHTNLLHREAGSWFFLGELVTDLPLPLDPPHTGAWCGSCTACIDVCPTRAIVAPYRLDARRCISYLTIELHGSIPEELRPAIGNRIYGCDDCQLVCPWNRHARLAVEPDFAVRNGLDKAELTSLMAWSEEEFNTRMQGSAIRRIGWIRWLRNIAVALGNGPATAAAKAALAARLDHASGLVREHVAWALARLEARSAASGSGTRDQPAAAAASRAVRR